MLSKRKALNPPTEAISQNLYFDKTFNCEAVKIAPGEYYFTNKNMAIVTVLGSCVSACITDIKNGIGGMNHYMLPDSAIHKKDDPSSEMMRYGSYAMEILINEILKNGGRRENLEAKIFGGGNVLHGFNALNIGERNAIFVRKYLMDEGIRITGEDLVESYSRKVYFFPKTAEVFVKKIKLSSNLKLIKREKKYAQHINTKSISGDIELF
ncbi:chemoreceptor glutamine deamidase CheD [Polynucleobacter sp. MWH-Mekk-B1]|uniref:chemoreceptor glutamine deamidase CheD n=1 Tax=Polynucleobacter finlandensis TaxID=1855894 RepID=UPI001C0C85CC|nr:chemoreceptor glutamine deamidase CheD [Polynucleobacter finlandensis]MBU3545134.1 chemoreceptor glutamine deamidase CheD [Polynucleobacter finlandensis]